jgi:oligopeptide transport system ATP-binding protein
LSAVPIPDPKLERSKVLLTYDPSIHREDAGELTDIGQGHLVYGSPRELEAYRAHRHSGAAFPEDLFQEPQPQTAMPQKEKRPWRPWALGIGAVLGAVVALFGLCLLIAGM